MTLSTNSEKEAIITTDYVGERWEQEVGDIVIVTLHGKKHETEVISHTYMTGIAPGGTIEYKVVSDEWKHVKCK